MAEKSSLVRLEEEFDIDVDWRGFELHPETPHGGRIVRDIYPAERLKEMREYMQMFAANFGVVDMVSPERIPNTRRSLAIAEYARDHGKLEEYRVLAMAAYWRDGKDLENESDLVEIAESTGLDGKAAIEASTSSEYLQRVDQLHQEASRLGITGIPTFIIGDQRIVGCQPYEAIVDAARRAGVPARDESANK